MATTKKMQLTRLDIVKAWKAESEKKEPMSRRELSQKIADDYGWTQPEVYAKMSAAVVALKKQGITLPDLGMGKGKKVNDLDDIKKVLGIA